MNLRVDLDDGQFATAYVVAKAMPLDADMFGAWTILRVRESNFEGAGVVLMDKGLVLFAEQRRLGEEARTGKGGVMG